ncbi:MAG: aminoacyl-histidine dipeptidase [Dysgonamonadaceae bacterium]|jgi:dipeptidase D|nr:aminoacyl-histidine dipeptidase [Dysgonamonadaceae bacterium]
MENILNLKPQNVWKYFYALTQIPRPSGHMDEITDFIENFGKKLGLQTTRDAANNICIRKPATPGYEKKPTVILQSHLDMVPQANSDTPFDFTKDKIQAYIDGNWVKAKGTTLGADNGIGVATTMAILEAADLQHGPLEGLFTTDEETGMYGALAVRTGFIDGKIMLNLDSELDGELYIGCAGGADVTAQFQYQNEEWIPDEEDLAVKVSLTGLKGGHSGVDIHLGRANANKLMFRFLKDALSTCDIRLASVSGGSLRNAIPREAFATIIVEGKERYERIREMVTGYENLFNEEFKSIENKIDFKAESVKIDPGMKLIPKSVQTKLTHAIMACPNNVINKFAEIPDTVETSINMAIVKSSEGLVEVKFLARSSSESKKAAICSSIESIFLLAGADLVETSKGYPGWDPNPKSAVLAVMEQVFEQQRGEKPKVEVMHAGLECGIILSNVPGLDTVSFGPTIQFPHSPDEKVEIASVQKFWDYLTAILKKI